MFAKNKDQKAEKKKESFSESISGIASVFVSGLFIITFILQAFEIPSESMEKTLLVGDHVFVDRLTPLPKANFVGGIMPYSEIKRGDVVVFVHPKIPGMYVVKRVMGIPGDRLRLRDGVVYRNGVALSESYLYPHDGSVRPYRDQFPFVAATPDDGVTPEWPMVMSAHIQNGELVVPAGMYFGMGDHRDVSQDSRFWGFIPRENVLGRPLFIYWSFITPSNQYQHQEMSERLAFLAHTIVHFFDETRWSRMFHMVR